jgi:hypothetical protein
LPVFIIFVSVFLCLVPIITEPSPRYFIALVLIGLGVAVYVPLVFYGLRPRWMGAYIIIIIILQSGVHPVTVDLTLTQTRKLTGREQYKTKDIHTVNKVHRTIITFLDIIHRLVFCVKCRPICISKHNVSETGFYLRPQVKPTTLLGPLDRASPYNNCYGMVLHYVDEC